jgi:hypothetical protein
MVPVRITPVKELLEYKPIPPKIEILSEDIATKRHKNSGKLFVLIVPFVANQNTET